MIEKLMMGNKKELEMMEIGNGFKEEEEKEEGIV